MLDHARVHADLVIHGGDFFFRSRVHPSVVDRAYQRIFDFADSGTPLVIVPGNHERSVLPPSLFLNHPHINVFDRPRTFVLEVAGEQIALTGFPFLRGVRQRFRQALVEAQPATASVDHRALCFHHAVEGAVVGPNDFTFKNGDDVIRKDDLPSDFDVVLSGHIHRHQILPAPTPLLYCGSTERTSFAEISETKGFCEIDFGRPGKAPSIKFVALPARPMVEFDGRQFGAARLLLHALETAQSEWPTGAIVRLRLADYPSRRLRLGLERLVPGILQLSCPVRPTKRNYARA